MDAATIIANIKSQALVGNTGSEDDEARILRYANKAYTELLAECYAANHGFFRRFQSMTITDGAGLFSYGVHEVLSVSDDNNNGARLYNRSVDDIQEEDYGLTATGNPQYYDRILNGLITYPRNSTTLTVGYTPVPVTLTAETLEADIHIPPAYHEAIEWATLWTIAYDERDKLSGAELQFTKARYEEIKGKLITYLHNQRPDSDMRTRAVL
ncbi:hypothetical protein Rleg2_1148 [Rhizobium leguminosarum bv. trifolii WSM2304]|uniref:Uncharacterized protein n=1 Tax=Rhizobium leguminosarum bv. trifolii (strain WSM2304) TaxID=395492 RepID=A0ABF7QKW4_RHILW|nr:hypothetical protein [Rhizobium leguminosarum]ACI54442.1 hypothetical protein Rleg2_1148 [Rhizobium leguminosarum bv. trifolii WSM2304]